MTEVNTSTNDNYDKYKEEQEYYWEKLRQELDRLKKELETNNSELAQGLSISRQPMVSFMQDSSNGLPIRRSNLIRLWDFLTDPYRFRDKNISEKAKLKREKLRLEGPDLLLKVAGFLPKNSQILEVESSRYHQIQRIVSKLSSPGIPLSKFLELTESIEERIRQRAFTNTGKLLNKEEAVTWAKTNFIKDDVFDTTIEKFSRAINKLEASGRQKFYEHEVFELYTSISDKEKFPPNNSKNREKSLKIRVTDCQFQTLTFSIHDYANDEDVQKEIIQIAFLSEAQLRTRELEKNTENLPISKFVEYPPVIKTLVICEIKWDEKKSEKKMHWLYTSSSTHVENMLIAVKRGMGCCSKLDLIELSIRNLGKTDDTLVRVSVNFSNKESQNNYQGLWIDRNTIISFLEATITASKYWLFENINSYKGYKDYYDVCQSVSRIESNLSLGIKALHEYLLQLNKGPNGKAANHYLEEVIKEVQELKKYILTENKFLDDWYGANLEHNYYIAKLMRTHSAHIEGDLTAAKKFLDLDDYHRMNDYIPASVLYVVENTIYQFLSGNKNFFNKKKWRSELSICLNIFYNSLNTKEDVISPICLDFNLYLCMSELFGNIGLLDLYTCKKEDIGELEKSISKLLMASYYSSKIGLTQETANWLVQVSRVYCRLGDGKRAKIFSNIAQNIANDVIESRCSYAYQKSVIAEINLAIGERYLLIEKDFITSIKYFLQSLKGAIFIGFSWIIADNLYGIAKASKEVGNYRLKTSFMDAFTEKELRDNEPVWKLRDDKQGWKENKIAANVIEFLNGLDEDTDWNLVSDKFRQQAKNIWHHWSIIAEQDNKAKHPIEDEIDSFQLLDRLR